MAQLLLFVLCAILVSAVSVVTTVLLCRAPTIRDPAKCPTRVAKMWTVGGDDGRSLAVLTEPHQQVHMRSNRLALSRSYPSLPLLHHCSPTPPACDPRPHGR